VKFPFRFDRRVGGAGPTPTLGNATDLARPGTPALPGAAPNFGKGQADDPAQAGGSNVFSIRLWDAMGWPLHRIAVGYHGPTAALNLPAVLWAFDQNLGVWLKVPQAEQVGSTAGVIIPESITFFDTLALSSLDATMSQGGGSARSGAAELCLVINVAGADPNGTYSFVMGGDLTTSA
jgi:hypothetical protein